MSATMQVRAPNDGLASGENTVSAGRAANSFWQLMLGTSVLAGVTHVAFVVLFYMTGVISLARVNLGSVLLYVVATYLLARGYGLFISLTLLIVEVLGHAVLASYWIGWDSGFYYYAILVVPILLVADIPSALFKGAAVIVTVALILSMDVVLRSATPPYTLSSHVLEGLHYFNLLTFLGILMFLVVTYFQLVNQAETQLRVMATTDPLTRLLNRRSMLEAWQHECTCRQRSETPLSLVLCDIDLFKSINDRLGHDAGDRVLQAVSETLSAGVREIDHVARWGGEEFLILLVGAHHDDALKIADQLRSAVLRCRIALPGEALNVTMTFGVSQIQGEESLDAAIARADAALYRGKAAGRDCVVA